MSTRTFFLNSNVAQYGEEELNSIQKFLFGQGILNTLGTSWEDWIANGDLKVSQRGAGANMSVDVKAGWGLLSTTRNAITFKVFCQSVGVTNLTISANALGTNRVDAVIMRVSRTAVPNLLANNVVTLEVITGTGVSALSDGAITTAISGDDFIRLANITVTNGDTDITNAQIADTRVRASTNSTFKHAPELIEFKALATDPTGTSLAEGMTWYNSSTHTLNFYNGTITKQLGDTSKLLSSDTLYTTGISVSQLTSDADVVFGQNDATTKRLKLAQSFVPSKSTISSISVKKGTPLGQTVTSDATMATPTIASTGIGYTDNGVVSSKRDISLNAGNHVGDYYEFTKTITGAVGDVCTGSVSVDRVNNGNTGSLTIYLDGVSIATGSIAQNSTTTLTYGFTSTLTSHVIKIRCQNTINTGSTQPMDRWYNFTHTAIPPFTYSLSLDVYADVAGVPSGASLGSATVTNANFNATEVLNNLNFNFSSPVSGLSTVSTYWLVLTSSVPSSTIYPSVRKITTSGYPSGVLKYNNTTDGWVTESGDLYFQVNQSPATSIFSSNPAGYLSSLLTPTDYLKMNLPATPFGAGSATPSSIHIGYDSAQAFPLYLWVLTSDVSANCTIYRYERQVAGNYVYKGVTATFAVTSGNISGITEMNGFVYVSYSASAVMACKRYTLALASPTQMTGGFVGQTVSSVGMVSDPTGGKIWCFHSSSLTDLGGYTVVGSAFTRSNTVTLASSVTSAAYKIGIASNGDFIFFDGAGGGATTIQRFTSAGAVVTSTTASILTYLANAVIGAGWFLAGAIRMSVVARKVNSEWSLEAQSIDL